MIGIINNFELPDRFFKLEESHGGRGLKWFLVYSTSTKKEVQIGFYYRGVGLDSRSTLVFRQLLSQPAKLIFNHQSSENYSSGDKNLIESLRQILDNAADNQVTNTDSDYVPYFYLETLETTKIKERPVLVIKGQYLGSQSKPTGYLYTLLFDRDNKSNHCHIEEIFFQASSKDLFDRQFVDFNKSLESIEFK